MQGETMEVDLPSAYLRHLQLGAPSGSGDNGTITILVIVLALFCIIWSPSLIRRCRNRAALRRAGGGTGTVTVIDASGRRLSQADLEAAIMRRLSESNILNTRSIQMSADDRREYISNVLLPKRIVLTDNAVTADDEHNNTLESDKYYLQRSHKSQSEDQTNHGDSPTAEQPVDQDANAREDDDDEHCCAICLTEYENDEEVCISNNKYCPHVFHRQCISEWLLTHEECPCCRHFFLHFVDNESDLEMVEGRTEQGRPALTSLSLRINSGVLSESSNSPEGEDDYDGDETDSRRRRPSSRHVAGRRSSIRLSLPPPPQSQAPSNSQPNNNDTGGRRNWRPFWRRRQAQPMVATSGQDDRTNVNGRPPRIASGHDDDTASDNNSVLTRGIGLFDRFHWDSSPRPTEGNPSRTGEVELPSGGR